MGTNQATPMTVEARRAEVARRAAAGESEREIARALGVSRTTVWTDKQVIDATVTSDEQAR